MGRNEGNARDSAGLRLHFDGFELDASSGELRMGDTRLTLQPQPFKVLALLASRSGRTVTREEIRRQLWSTGTFVDFEGGLNFCIRQIRKTLGENARKPRYIETIHRRGYRFIATVTRIDDATPSRFSPPASGPHLLSNKPLPITLAVLPFRDLSCSHNEDLLADGITELLITYLSTNSSLRVVSRTTTMRYKGTDKSLGRIARELGADRVLEGAVLHSGMRVRITARLIDTSTDQNEWAACYDAEMRDRFMLQDHVACAVACDTAIYLMPALKEKEFGRLRSNLPDVALLKSAGRVWTMPLGTISPTQAREEPAMVPGLIVADGRHSQRSRPS